MVHRIRFFPLKPEIVLCLSLISPIAVETAGALPAQAGRPTAPTAAPRPKVVNRISPEIHRWFSMPAYRCFRGRKLPGGCAAALALDRVSVTVRLAGARDRVRLKQLQSADLRLRSVAGKPAVLGRFAVMLASRRGIAILARTPFVERVELDMIPPTDPPLDLTAAEVEATAAWHTLNVDGVAMTGEGVVIADIDTSVDVFHPSFFKPDGGYFAWIDVNENERFDPGTDVVDLDGDGAAAPTEILRFFDGEAYCLYTSMDPILDSADGAFDVGWDWLYADLNGNEERDFGADAGFDEQDPTLGEPVLLVDDINGNGALDPGEKLIALGTSKFVATFDGNTEYRRGENLLDAPVDSYSGHATGVAGILAGGAIGLTTLTGLAPRAELLVASHGQDPYGSITDLFVWTVQNDADVVLHEYAPWAGTHLDGSTNQEQMMDDAAEMGIPQVTPTGNLGGAKKHCNFELEPGGELALPVIVPQDPPWGGEYAYLSLTFHWRLPARDMAFALETPQGELVDLGTGDNYLTLSDGTTMVQSYRDDSNRGTAMYDIVVAGWDGYNYFPIENGQWTLTITDVSATVPTEPACELSGYVMDNVTSWEQGAYFPEHTSERHLLCFPSTADSAISLAAYTGHDELPYDGGNESAGQLRRYSCRGKRIDGVSVMDIAAPDNPLSPINRGAYTEYGLDIGHGAYMVFGGTSGAGPHVAAAVALLKQQNPDLTGDEAKQRIRDGALVDDDVVGDSFHAVEDLWGAGKLRIYRSLYAETPAANTPPFISLSTQVERGQAVDIVPTVTDEQDADDDLQLRWDDDYDGAWDHGPHPFGQPRQMTFDATGIYTLKVAVIDTGGMTAETLGEIEVIASSTDPDGGPSDGGVDGATSSGGGGGGGCGCRSASGHPMPAAFLLVLILTLGLSRWRRCGDADTR